jgi:hypothetical protein
MDDEAVLGLVIESAEGSKRSGVLFFCGFNPKALKGQVFFFSVVPIGDLRL